MDFPFHGDAPLILNPVARFNHGHSARDVGRQYRSEGSGPPHAASMGVEPSTTTALAEVRLLVLVGQGRPIQRGDLQLRSGSDSLQGGIEELASFGRDKCGSEMYFLVQIGGLKIYPRRKAIRSDVRSGVGVGIRPRSLDSSRKRLGDLAPRSRRHKRRRLRSEIERV